MLRNFFNTALRDIVKNKIFSAINIIGLALGLSCSLLIYLWADDESKIDKFNIDAPRIQTVYQRMFSGTEVQAVYTTPAVLAEEMKQVLPAVELSASLTLPKQYTLQSGDILLKEEGAFAGTDFFKIFNLKVIEGNGPLALSSPSDIAISRKIAVNFFGSPEKALGKALRFEDQKDLMVSAVFDDVEKSSLKFEYLINWQAYFEKHPRMKSWDKSGVYTYVKLQAGIDPVQFEEQTKKFLYKYYKFEEGYSTELGFQRFDEMYLHSNFNSIGKPEGGRIEYVNLFSVIAVFIIFIACINFMNLATARSANRGKEIGIRKVVGAVRSSLIRQHIAEAILVTFFSVVIALLLVFLLLPFFNIITQKQIHFPINSAIFWVGILLLTLVVGFISGSYPALVLSAVNPISILKGRMKLSGNAFLRKGLVVFQFVLSVMLIIGTIVVSNQVNYIQSKNLGYNRENLIYIPQEGELKEKFSIYKSSALGMAGIQSVSRIGAVPTNITGSTWAIDWEGKNQNTQPIFAVAGIGYDFLETMNIQISEGRGFSQDVSSDSVQGFILNEAAVKLIGYKDPIGKPFTLWDMKGKIVGVVTDFHFNSLHAPVNPLIMFLDENDNHGGHILIKTEPDKTAQALKSLAALNSELNPKFPFTFYFADEEYNKLYNSEQMVSKLSNYFAFLATLISSLGLLGLAMFTTGQRTKEIGIRKVLGADSASLFGLLSKEFIFLVLIALIIAFPLAWIFLNKWLQNFAYQTDITLWMFIAAGVAAILITLLTTSYQTIKAVIANPVKILRIE